MKKQLYLIIMLLIVGLFSVIMGFMFDAIESMKFIDANATLIYWLGKGISLGLLVVVAIYLIAKKGDAGNT